MTTATLNKILLFAMKLQPSQTDELLDLMGQAIQDEKDELETEREMFIAEHQGIKREPQIKGTYEAVAIAGSYDQLRA